MTQVLADIGPAACLAGEIGPISAAIADLSAAPTFIVDLAAGSQTATESSTLDGSSSTTPDDPAADQALEVEVSGGGVVLDVSRSDTFRLDLSSDLSSFSLAGWPAAGLSKRVAIYFVQDAVGGHAVTWPAFFKWSAGVVHTLSAGPGAIDCFVFGSIDGGATVFGNVVGLSYA